MGKHAAATFLLCWGVWTRAHQQRFFMGQWDVLPWGLSHCHWLWWEWSTPHSRAHPSDTDRDPLTKLSVRTCSLHFLCTLLFLFALVRPSFLPASPSQCPASAVLPLAGPFKLHHHTKQEQTPPAPSWSKWGTCQMRPQIVKNDLNLNQWHASGLIWGFFVVQCQCKAMANLVFPHGSTSWRNDAFSTWNDQEQSSGFYLISYNQPHLLLNDNCS